MDQYGEKFSNLRSDKDQQNFENLFADGPWIPNKIRFDDACIQCPSSHRLKFSTQLKMIKRL